MDANPSYWRPGLPKTESLEFVMNLSAQEIASGFRSGKLSLGYFLEADEVESLLYDPHAQHKEIAWMNTFYMVFNGNKGVFADFNIRKKVMDSLNVEAIVQQTRRFAAPARTLVPPALLGYEAEKPTYRPVTKFVDSEIVVSISTAGKGSWRKMVNEVLQTLSNMGFKIRISELVAEQAVRQHHLDIDIIMVNWIADYPDADGVVFPLLYKHGGLNSDFASTDSINQLIERARVETDQELRHSLYRGIEEEIREQALVIPLIHDQFYVFSRPEVQGLELNYFYPTINFEGITIRR
jgi:peptide/nickel transport system substrate-binding protein